MTKIRDALGLILKISLLPLTLLLPWAIAWILWPREQMAIWKGFEE